MKNAPLNETRIRIHLLTKFNGSKPPPAKLPLLVAICHYYFFNGKAPNAVVYMQIPSSTYFSKPRSRTGRALDEETGEVRWVATEVNLDDHVVVPKLESNIESPDMFVEDYIASLTNPKLDKSKPLWDLHILNIKTSESEGVIVYRIHHSIGDGMSIMSLLLACSRKVSDPMALPTIPEVRNSSQKKKIGFWAALQLIWNTLVGVILFVATSLFLKDTKTPLKGPVGGENNPRRVLKLTTSLDDVKLVKNAMNATINDVVLAVTEAGLSRYLNRRYGFSSNDGQG